MPKVSITKAADFGELAPWRFTVDRKTGNVRNPDGSTRLTYDFSDLPAGHTVMLTGPISALVETADGTVYDVTPHAIAVKDEHVDEVHRAILREHQAQGRFLTASA